MPTSRRIGREVNRTISVFYRSSGRGQYPSDLSSTLPGIVSTECDSLIQNKDKAIGMLKLLHSKSNRHDRYPRQEQKDIFGNQSILCSFTMVGTTGQR